MLNFLTGERGLRQQRDLAEQFADEFYGGQARSLSPVRQEAVRRATEGIGEATQGSVRETASRNIMRQPDLSVVGGNQGAAIGMSSRQSMAGMEALSDIETNLASANIQAKQEGLATEAQTRAEQTRLETIQKAAKTQANMEYEAERSSRRQELFAGALGLTAAFAPEIGSAFGNMFGTQTPETSGTRVINPDATEPEMPGFNPFNGLPDFNFLYEDNIQFDGEMIDMPVDELETDASIEEIVETPNRFPTLFERMQIQRSWRNPRNEGN